jgi:hypothetical protein
LSATNRLTFTEPKNNLCLFLIWKLQKVYDENPDCGQLSGFGWLNQISKGAFTSSGQTRFFFVNYYKKLP